MSIDVTRSRGNVVVGNLILLSSVLVVSACGGAGSGPSSATTSVTPSSSVSSTAAERGQKFLAAVGGQMSEALPEDLLSMGARTCSAFGEGSKAADVRDILMRRGLSEAQASRVVLAAVVAFCPEYQEKANP